MNVWQPLIFFDGEDEEGLKTLFIQTSARHYNNPNFDMYDVAKLVFRDLKEPGLRAMQAADYWSKDIEIQDAIINLVNYGDEVDAKKKRIALLMKIAENPRSNDKDRISAIRVAAELEGEITKAVEKKVTHIGNAKPLGSFLFKIDHDADKKPEEADEDDDE